MKPRRLKVPPTKSSLLALRKQLRFLEQGHDMLERKRELLTRLVYQRLREYRNLRDEARAAIESAYRWLGMTHMRTGRRILEQAALGADPMLRVSILPRRSLGVRYPAVDAETLPPRPVGLLGTDASFDETRRGLAMAAATLARLGQVQTALDRLMTEQRRVQKRVNALRYNIIPRVRDTIHYVDAALEEEERNSLFQVKLLRDTRFLTGE